MTKLIYIIILICFGNGLLAQTISVETKIGKSLTHYTFIKKNSCRISFSDKRPDKTDPSVLACIPAAFTDLNTSKVDGAYAVNGRIEHKTLINKTLGGVFYIDHTTCKIFQSGKGKRLNDSLFTIVKKQKASFFQQLQCVQDGKAASFIDKKTFQRRGIAILSDNTIAIIESTEAITLKTFSEDLVFLGVKQLIYTDMGAWDEGWYKDPVSGKPVVIGRDLSQTARQSNWIVFEK